ncbi:MAG: hypothetical protein ACE5EX_07120, partial [Phycisphaerae bacterium]
ATNGNAWMIGINVPDRIGQTENRSEGSSVCGVGFDPPWTLQESGREVLIDDAGTPLDPTDDTWTYGVNGMTFPCETDYILAVDIFGGTIHVNQYTLHDPAGAGIGVWDPTPDNTADPNATLFAEKFIVADGPINDGDDALFEQGASGFSEGGFDNTNELGVTDTDGTTAASATTGLELAVPFSAIPTDLGVLTGTEQIQVYVILVDGVESNCVGDNFGHVVNQVLPPLAGGAPCDPPGLIGFRPDLSASMACLDVDLGAVATFGGGDGLADGAIDPLDYDPVVGATQACPTPYGDQFFDASLFTRSGGSELDGLYVTSDAVNLYLGITGNLEENGNRLLIWLDNNLDVAPLGPGPEDGVHILSWDGMGPGGNGMEGDAMPPLESDPLTDALFDYVVAVNVTGPPPNSNIFVDLWDIFAQASSFKGVATMESGSGMLETQMSGGSNQWGMQVALNNLNSAGVLGCGFFDVPCWFDDSLTVAAAASGVTSGFEIAIPLADLGVNPCDGPTTIHVWANVTGNDGWRSNQSLPSLRGDGEESVWQPENNLTDWYVTAFGLPEDFYRAVAFTHVTTPGIENDCDGSGTEDVCDILNGLLEDLDLNGVPDVCQLACASDADCDDAALCTIDLCGAGSSCAVQPALFGDVNNDGFANADDVNCLLDDIGGNPQTLACCDRLLGTCGGPGDKLPAVPFQNRDLAPCLGCPLISVNPDVYDCNIDCSAVACPTGLTCVTLSAGLQVCRDPNNMGDGFKSADDVNAVLDTIGGAPPSDTVMAPCMACLGGAPASAPPDRKDVTVQPIADQH